VIRGWLANRWLVGALAWAGFSLVVWFLGDALALGEARPLEAPAARIALIVLAAAAWLGREGWRLYDARRQARRLLESIARAGAQDESAQRAAQEIAALRARFEEAAATLRSARFEGPDGTRRYVHELPWYVFIGAPGSGKTTALVNSGLRFPLEATEGAPALQGVGGTRNCDWWFTEDAVLLDTAGRYTTQDSDRGADAAAWHGFLELLKEFRPRQPLNGAILTVSVSDLMLWSKEERARYAAHVRMRLAELYARLGLRFPIYVLVTKADLIAGFMEFFGELDPDERARVWGMTFDYSPDAAMLEVEKRFSEEFSALERRLNAEMVERLQRESDLQRRAAIYRFPQQFSGLGSLLADFFKLAFANQQNGRGPLARGVYFTSGTQEGSPIDRVLGAITRSLSLDRKPLPVLGGVGKSFFLNRLLREVIFPEAGLVAADEARERAGRSARALAYGALAVGFAAVVVAWTMSYFGNRDFVAAAQAETVDAKRRLEGLAALRGDDIAPLVGALNALRDLPGGYRARERGTPLALGFGLYQGEKLGALAERAYRNALGEALLPRLAAALEQAMRSAASREEIAAALEAYLSLYDEKGPAPEALEAAANRLWPLAGALRAELAGHLRAGLEEKPLEMRHARNDALVKEARERLAAAKPS
jgi:type VI secretion system protein ImpL